MLSEKEVETYIVLNCYFYYPLISRKSSLLYLDLYMLWVISIAKITHLNCAGKHAYVNRKHIGCGLLCTDAQMWNALRFLHVDVIASFYPYALCLLSQKRLQVFVSLDDFPESKYHIILCPYSSKHFHRIRSFSDTSTKHRMKWIKLTILL